ncbi:MAG TPA: VIT1/CCC1 transporter family protein [Mycobacteriales bacterium]|nr:VIT1/CCC1 transporter family protein [Mycobacteriales bacterium]
MSETAVDHRAEVHHHTHRDVSGGWLRPAVFGAMDGLVSNVALISGVAAAVGTHVHVVIVTGLAGLLAGAGSMAVGEWTSVNSQRELVHAEIEKERRELVRRPHAEQAELATLFVSRGLSRELAVQVARELSRDPESLWRIHVREELGVDPDALPSPYVAALSSLLSFAAGAFVPLLPYLLGASQLWITLVVAALALAALGASVARFTERPLWWGAVRQLGLGAAAAGVTYGVGSAFGVGLS